MATLTTLTLTLTLTLALTLILTLTLTLTLPLPPHQFDDWFSLTDNDAEAPHEVRVGST